jgi:DNA-binding MarR family transcriptional regulator
MTKAATAKIAAAPSATTPDFGPLPNLLGFLVTRVSNRIINGLEQALDGVELTVVGFVLLTLIHRNPGISQVEVASALRVRNATVTGALNRLEKQTLVLRTKHGRDRRQNLLFLSKTGQELRRRAERRLTTFEQSLEALYGAPRANSLKASLRRLDLTLGEHPYFSRK